ncbi:MAG TPA: DUF2062 domain-containing protein [Thermoanaerobaculia bacterium]|nr:DUF2062 domain-containing protein [Thermoanaerobaculia bacterium]
MSPDQQIFDQEERHRAQRVARMGRLRRWLRPLPRRSNLPRYPVIRWFEEVARRRPYLWSFGPRPLRRAIYVGAVIAFLPVYGLQILLAFWAAVLLRANLAVTCALQLVTNPVTAGPLYYFTYRVGSFLIRTSELGEGQGALGTRINALVLGGIVVGLAAAVAVDLLYRLALWEARRLRDRHRTVREAAEVARSRGATRPAPLDE